MSAGAEPSEELMKRAYARMARPGWPDFHTLRMLNLKYQAVRAMAAQLERGHAPAAETTTAVQSPALPAPSPAAKPATHPTPKHPPQFSARDAAAGTYVHSGDDE